MSLASLVLAVLIAGLVACSISNNAAATPGGCDTQMVDAVSGKVIGTAQKCGSDDVHEDKTEPVNDRATQSSTNNGRGDGSDVPDRPAQRVGPTYEELVARALNHNRAERAKQAASEVSQANCVDGETLAHLMHSCNPSYEAQLMDMPDRPAPAAPAPAAPAPVGNAAPAPPPKITKENVWLKVKATLSTKPATPRVGPDYSVHHLRSEVTGQPLDSVVGYPLWFWAEGGDLSAKEAKQKLAGMTVSLSMKPGKVTINPGDGSTFTCANNGTEWTPQVEVGAASPTCGYKYEKTGTYTVSMTTQWTVHYVIDNGEGEPLVGDETLSGTRTRQLRIGELQVVTVDG